MENIIDLVKTIRFPSVLIKQGQPIFQNELFSIYFDVGQLEPSGSLHSYLALDTCETKVVLPTRHGKTVAVTLNYCNIGKNEDLRILTLIDDKEELTKFSVDQMESGRFVALGQLAGGIAHEINNPLTVVLSKLHLVERLTSGPEISSEATAKIKDSVEKARSSVMRISKVIKGLRSLSRDGRADDFQVTNIADVITETVELCQERIKENGIILDLEIDRDLFVRVRPYQIVQVLINLVNNAIDALEGQNLGKILIKVLRIGDEVVLRVSDSGPGVKEGHESMVMEPFFTTKPAGVGTGLGLSISRQIVFSHGGRISLNREVSASCFEIQLPINERRAA